MVIKPHPDEEYRKKIVTKEVKAHEIALEEWSDERIEELSDPVKQDPHYGPLTPDPIDAEFLDRQKEIRSELEAEPTGYHTLPSGERVVAGWRAYLPDD